MLRAGLRLVGRWLWWWVVWLVAGLVPAVCLSRRSPCANAVLVHCPSGKSSHAASGQDAAGGFFHEFVAQQDLLVPTTFEAFTPPGDGWTWQSSAALVGGRHRIGFVAVPSEWQPLLREARVLEEVNLALDLFVDHRPGRAAPPCQSIWSSSAMVLQATAAPGCLAGGHPLRLACGPAAAA